MQWRVSWEILFVLAVLFCMDGEILFRKVIANVCSRPAVNISACQQMTGPLPLVVGCGLSGVKIFASDDAVLLMKTV